MTDITYSSGKALGFFYITFTMTSLILSTIIRGLVSQLSWEHIKRKRDRVVVLNGSSIASDKYHTALHFRMDLCGVSLSMLAVTGFGKSSIVSVKFWLQNRGAL